MPNLEIGELKMTPPPISYRKILESDWYESAPPFNNPRGLSEKNEIETEVNSKMKNEMNFNLA